MVQRRRDVKYVYSQRWCTPELFGYIKPSLWQIQSLTVLLMFGLTIISPMVAQSTNTTDFGYKYTTRGSPKHQTTTDFLPLCNKIDSYTIGIASRIKVLFLFILRDGIVRIAARNLI